jgi:hypothetical protein
MSCTKSATVSVLNYIVCKNSDGCRTTEYRIQNTEYRIQNTEYRIQNTVDGKPPTVKEFN